MEEKESTMSGSTGGNSYTDSPPPVSSNVLLPQPPPPASQVVVSNLERNIDLSRGAVAVTSALENNNNSGGSGDLFGKKKRGRPRKYDSEGNLRLQHFSYPLVSSPPGFTLTPSDYSSSKRGRGRPPGSGNWQLLASLGKFWEIFFSSLCLVAEKMLGNFSKVNITQLTS